MEKGVPIRSVSRSLAVLRAINRQGSMSMAEIARVAAVPYPTACRLVQTLMHEELIEREPARKRYRPTAFVRALSAGFQEHSELVALARPHLEQLTALTRWPVLLSTRYGGEMMVRDCTDALTSQVLDRHYPGHTFSLLETAGGRAYLAFAGECERAEIFEAIEMAGETPIDPHTYLLIQSDVMLEEIREQGVAQRGRNRFSLTPGKTSSIGAPVFANGRVVGAIDLVYFSVAYKSEDALRRYGDEVKRCAAEISRSLSSTASDDLPEAKLRRAV
ncbi:helix-turn-helix domain-containing protein [uncultured Brevundimonas sp.]|uniref:IclR family transcriptional regulator n=1 Tax=uncultured Brevundimonas sp. TaxID=213418 RepID=UPI0026072356|nr:helix-turn-helix domain-containing protein [uncultured Brevundimonas sp.]